MGWHLCAHACEGQRSISSTIPWEPSTLFFDLLLFETVSLTGSSLSSGP